MAKNFYKIVEKIIFLSYNMNMTKNERDELNLEEQSFNKYMKDPRTFWQSVGFAILQRPAQKPVQQLNRDGEETENSKIESMTYETLKDNLKTINEDVDGTREPTEIEMIIACQAQHARHSTPAATFIRDTMGAKPVDRQNIEAQVSDYSQLSDEELNMLVEYRANKAKKENESCAPSDTQPTIVDMEDNDELI